MWSLFLELGGRAVSNPAEVASTGKRDSAPTDVSDVAAPLLEAPPEPTADEPRLERIEPSQSDATVVDLDRERSARTGSEVEGKEEVRADKAAQPQDEAARTTDADAADADALSPPPKTEPAGVFGKLTGAVGSKAQTVSESVSAAQVQEFRELARKSTSTEPTVVDELSTALGLAHTIRNKGYTIDLAYPRLRFIFDCLLDADPKLKLARDERLRLQLDIYSRSDLISRTLARISAGSSAALVIAALVASFVIWAAFLVLVRLLVDSGISPLSKDLFFMDGQALAVVASGAFLGGIVSIATRLREFSRVSDLDPFSMFWTAMLKPLISVVIAIFILATLVGGVISFGFLDPKIMGFKEGATAATDFVFTDKAKYILWMLAFLAGFSERFAWDFVDRAQGAAQGGPGTAPAKKD